jgi:hypothetical protein
MESQLGKGSTFFVTCLVQVQPASQATVILVRADVAYWHKAEVSALPVDVRSSS